MGHLFLLSWWIHSQNFRVAFSQFSYFQFPHVNICEYSPNKTRLRNRLWSSTFSKKWKAVMRTRPKRGAYQVWTHRPLRLVRIGIGIGTPNSVPVQTFLKIEVDVNRKINQSFATTSRKNHCNMSKHRRSGRETPSKFFVSRCRMYFIWSVLLTISRFSTRRRWIFNACRIKHFAFLINVVFVFMF